MSAVRSHYVGQRVTLMESQRGKSNMTAIKLAKIGDIVEVDFKSPYGLIAPGTQAFQLNTPEACAYANELLMNKSSGWRLRESTEASSHA